MIIYLDDHKASYGVEPICRLLEIAPPSYYAARRPRNEFRGEVGVHPVRLDPNLSVVESAKPLGALDRKVPQGGGRNTTRVGACKELNIQSALSETRGEVCDVESVETISCEDPRWSCHGVDSESLNFGAVG